MQPDLHNDQLVAVNRAFDSLLLTVYQLTHRQNEICQYMDEVFEKVRSILFYLSFCFCILVSHDDEKL